MKPARVLMTADTVGGVWTYALELSRALEGVSVTLATMGRPLTAGQRAEAARIPNLEIFESSFRLEWMDDPWDDVARAGEWLLDLEACVRPDVVHLNGYAHGALAWRAPVIVVAHSCVLSWWRAVKGEAAPPQWDRYREEIRRGLQAADLVAAPTQAMLTALRVGLGGRIPNARVIPNGRNPHSFRTGPKTDVVFAAGRLWDEAKNVSALARAAPRLRWPVYLAGDDEHPAGGEGNFQGARLLGRLSEEELAGWYARAGVYALPARYEPFGLSVLEAALSGCALVLGDIPSLRENWSDAALFVPPNDEAALERTLNNLAGDTERRAELQAGARARASWFTPERMAEGYLASYRDVLAAQAREPVCA